MKNLLHRFSKEIIQMIIRTLAVLFVIGSFASSGYSSPGGILTTTGATICGEGSLVLHATASSGSTIKWYTVPFYGTAIGAGNPAVEGTVSDGGTTFTTPSQIVTTAYYVDAVDASNCSLNPGRVRVPVLATISANSIQASIFYASTTFCKSVATAQEVARTGSAGGVFSYTGSGSNVLTLNTSTGAVTPSSSIVGTYTVTYTVTAAQGCIENPASTTVIIANAPLTSSIAYTSSPYCTSLTSATVNLTNANSGVYSADPSGLIIDASSGTINPSLSEPGTYTVTYDVSGAGGCAPQAPTALVTITELPAPVIAYANSPFCKDIATAQSPVLTGAGAYTGGTYRYTNSGATQSGLTFSSGAITPGTSTAGTYTIYYSAPASGNCSAVEVSTSVTVSPLPTATIGGTTSICQNATEPTVTFTGTSGTSPFTFTYTVNGGGNQTVSTTSGSSVTVAQPTTSAGTYTYTLLSVADANECSQAVSGSPTATITVIGTPVATFSYIGTPFCQVGTVSPTLAPGASKGTFSGTNVVFISTSTGEINLASTPAGTYTITNTISTCGTPVAATTDVTINTLPTASIGGSTACGSSVLTATTNATSPSYVWYLGGSVIAGEISSTLTASANGSYTVKVRDGSNGCEKTSDAFTVTLIALPTASITGTLSTCVTQTTLTAVTDATSPSYVWYKNGDVIGGNTSTLTTTGSGDYKVKVHGSNTCESTSAAVFVSIALVDDPGTVGGGQTVCTDASNSTALTLSGTKSTVRKWQYSVSPFSTWTDITNTTSAYTATGLTQTTQFRAAVQNGICDVAYSVAATVTVVADPAISVQPTASTSECIGGTAQLSVTATGGTPSFTYQWYTNGSTNSNSGGSAIEGATASTYTPPTASAGTVYYYVIVAAAGSGCGTDKSNVAAVTTVADPVWTIGTTPSASITYGGSVTFAATITNGFGGTVSWIRATSAGQSGTTVTSPDTPPAAGTYYYRPSFTSTVSGCNLTDGTETTVVVGQKALTITATGPTKIYGTALTAGTSAINFTAGATGVGSETVTSVTLTPDAAGLSDVTAGGAAYVVTPSLATGTGSFVASNYNITYSVYNGTVAKAESTIAATGTTSFTYSAGVPQGPATSTVTGSTGTVTYSYLGINITTYAANATKPTQAGDYTVTATVPADTNFNTKTSAAYTFQIIPLAPTGTDQSFCSGAQ